MTGLQRQFSVTVAHTLDTQRNLLVARQLDAFNNEVAGTRYAGNGAELWFDSLEALAENGRRPEAQAAGALLLEDEKRFIDLPKSPLWWGQERVVVG